MDIEMLILATVLVAATPLIAWLSWYLITASLRVLKRSGADTSWLDVLIALFAMCIVSIAGYSWVWILIRALQRLLCQNCL